MTIRPDKRQRDRARALRRNATEAEKALWRQLLGQQLGVKFRRQEPVGDFIADFLCHPAKLVIEVDGGQHAGDGAYDAGRSAFVAQKGFRVIRFWNNEVLGNIDGVLTVVNEAVWRGP